MIHGLPTAAGALASAAFFVLSSVFAAPAAGAAVPAPAGLQSGTETYYVRGNGDDAAHGTREAPFRTITRALETARGNDAAARVILSVGTYDAAAGERFPLDLTGGVKITGLGSSSAVIDAGEAPLALRVGAESGLRAVIAGVQVRGSGVGLGLGAASDESAGSRSVLLRDVLFQDLATGVALDLGSRTQPLPIALEAHGLRTRDVRFGLRAIGEGRLDLHLFDCDLRRGEIGLAFESDPTENVDEARLPGEENVALVDHAVRLERVSVSEMTRAGLLRVGRDGRNRGLPYQLVGCRFVDNYVGVEFRRPCLDSELHVSGSSFLGNTQAGLRIAGDLGPGDLAETRTELQGFGPLETRIQDCTFRWNGVGAHVTNAQIPLVVRRSRFTENVGNGAFVSNFLTEPTTVRFESSLFVRNGGHGLYSLADARLQSVAILGCTIADNDAGGVRDHRRHSGTSEFELRGCLLDGNGDGQDLAGIDPQLVRDSFVGAAPGGDGFDPAFEARGNRTGHLPGFVEREAGDYRLTAGSVLRESLGTEASEGLPALDLQGRPRVATPGCFAGSLH